MRLKDNWYQRVVHILTGIALLAVWLHLLLAWRHLPAQIPTNFDFSGEPTDWGGKASVLISPIICTVTAIILFVVEWFPQTWNTGVQVTPLNQAFVYRTLKNMLATLELAMVLTFGIVDYFILQAVNMPVWVLPVMLLLIMGPIVFFLIRLVNGSKKFRI